jgi:2,5-diketo-D-gluconate reductase B
MQYINIKGLKVPALGFGTWQLTDEKAVSIALETGYRHIDTAQIYENEQLVGNAIANSGIDRKDIFLTTKLWTTNFKTNDVHSSFQESLDKLQTDYVDLFLIHWPNEEVPLQETLSAMQEIKDSGKIKAIGVSNFPVTLMKQALDLGFDLACNQVEYHVMLSQNPVLKFARENDMFVIGYSPLARGSLENNPTLLKLAKKHNKSIAQIALRWLMQQENVAAIPKASHEQHIRTNFEIFDFTLDDIDLDTLEAMNGNHRLVNPDFAPQWDKAA